MKAFLGDLLKLEDADSYFDMEVVNKGLKEVENIPKVKNCLVRHR